MATKLQLRLIGTANGVPLDLTGVGEIDQAAAKLDVRLSWSTPLVTVDPALFAFGLDWLLVLGRGHAIPDDDPMVVRVVTEILDEDGREAGEWKAVFEVRRQRSTVTIHGELSRCEVRMEPRERVTRVELNRTVLIGGIADACVATTLGAFETGRGGSYRFVTMAQVGMGMPSTATSAFNTAWRIVERAPNAVRLAAKRNAGHRRTRTR